MWRICRIIKWNNIVHHEVLTMSSFELNRFVPLWSPFSSITDYTHFNDYPNAVRVLHHLESMYGKGFCYIEEVLFNDD